MINISIQAPNINQSHPGFSTNNDDLTFNEIESVYELVSERMFNIDVPESDEPDTDNYIEIFDLYWASPAYVENNLTPLQARYKQLAVHHFENHFPEFTSPPPKRA